MDLKRMAKAAGYTVQSFKKGHYSFVAVLQNLKDGRLVRVFVRDVRLGWKFEAVYHTMAHEKDSIGGYNRFCRWDQLGEILERGVC